MPRIGPQVDLDQAENATNELGSSQFATIFQGSFRLAVRIRDPRKGDPPLDIRTKLALALVSVSLLSMLVLGTFAYQTAYELLAQVSERNLDALAETKQRDLKKVIQGWRERVELIRSRTRLRTLLARSDGKPDSASLREIQNILDDARDSVASVDRVVVFDIHGQHIATAGTLELEPTFEPIALERPDAVHFGGASVEAGDHVTVRFHAALRLDERTVGITEVVFHADELLTVTQDYTGLGETGETLVIVEDRDHYASALTPLRHDVELGHIALANAPCASSAMGSEEKVLRTGVVDYRGEVVWCATRALPEVGWGLVVKIDRDEELQRAIWLRDQMTDLGLALGAVAILGGTLLGMRLGRPLRDLRDVVERIREGESDLRADPSQPDEVGFLAQEINELLDQQKDP